MKRILLLAVVGLLNGACAAKVMILQSPVVSMKKANTPAGAKLVEGKPVNLQWCTGDDPVVDNDDGSKLYGMIDQVLYKAHKETKSEFFVDNRFYSQGSCVILQANTAKVSGGGGGGGDDEEAEAPPAKGKKSGGGSKGGGKKKGKKG